MQFNVFEVNSRISYKMHRGVLFMKTIITLPRVIIFKLISSKLVIYFTMIPFISWNLKLQLLSRCCEDYSNPLLRFCLIQNIVQLCN